MELKLVVLVIKILKIYRTCSGTKRPLQIAHYFCISVFVALLGIAATSADTSEIVEPGSQYLGQNHDFVNDVPNASNLTCDASYAGRHLEDEIRTSDREALLGSVNESMIKSCEITSEEVGRRLLSKKVVLVDIRPANEFESYQISGSLNLPSFEIKNKSFLKSKHLIIVGNRSGLMDMGLLCHELKLQGFKKVNFVSGGIGSWGKELVGRDAGSINQWAFGKITPRKFASLRSKMKWIVLDVVDDLSEKKDESSYGDLKVESFDIRNPEIINKVNNYIDTFSGTKLFGILIVAKNDTHYRRVESYLKGKEMSNIFYLEGGSAAFKRYWAEREAFLARLKRGPLVLNSCGST